MKHKRNPNVVFYTHEYPPYLGGIGEAAFTVFSSFKHAGKQVLTTRYIGTDAVFDDEDEDQSRILRFRAKENRLSEYLAGFKALAKLVLKDPDSIFLAWDRFSQRNCWLLSYFMPINYYNICIGTEVIMNHARRGPFNFSAVYKRSQMNIPISQYVGDLLEKFDVSDISREFHLGVRQHFFDLPRDEILIHQLRERFQTQDRMALVSLSRLDKRKGHDVILEAISKLDVSSRTQFRYIIAGDGQEAENLRQQVINYNLSDIVRFAGRVSEEEKLALLDLADIYVLASRQEGVTVEGLGLSYIEAQARGTAVIGGDHGGVAEVIEHGKSGLLVDPHSATDIANSISIMLNDEELRSSCAKYGACVASEKYNLKSAAESLGRILWESDC